VESATYQRKLWAEREKKSEKIVRDAGATIVELTDKSAFINAMKPVYTKIATDPEVKAILTKIQAVK
jgi:TRAP-type C4-dicarboxylate transport system substrate-binding protein